jgi:hypothetical protein
MGGWLKQFKILLGAGKNAAFPSPPYLFPGKGLLTHAEAPQVSTSCVWRFWLFPELL